MTFHEKHTVFTLALELMLQPQGDNYGRATT
jgi:hypothetical protein